MTTFAVTLEFDRDEETRLAVRPAHRDYLAELAEAGQLLQAGPYADGSGALLVYDVADRAALDEVLAADPYFSEEPVATIASIKEWQPLPLGH